MEKSLIFPDDMLKKSHTVYFANLIASKERHPEALFGTIKMTVAPDVPQVRVNTKSNCSCFYIIFKDAHLGLAIVLQHFFYI